MTAPTAPAVATGAWDAPLAPGPVVGTVPVPGSKSLTNRYLLLAALADGPGRVRHALRSRDTRLMAGALRALGAEVREDPGTGSAVPDLVVTPPAGGVFHAGRVDCGLAGTVMRFVPLLAALADGPVHVDGDAQARRRPVGTTVATLRALGCVVEDDGRGTLPFTVEPALEDGRPAAAVSGGGELSLDCSSSSQFLSAALLVGARFAHGVTVHAVGGTVPSLPHVAMTCRVLTAAGVEVEADDPTWRVAPGPIAARDVTVEPDLTNAGAFLAAAAATGGRVTVPHWPADFLQAGPQILAALAALGADHELGPDGLTLTGPDRLRGADLDLHEIGEFAPTVAALAALADGPTRLRGIAHLRGHETDRLAALHRELAALGGDVDETPDGLVVRPRPLHGGVFGTHADHRMAMAGAILGLRVPGVVVEDIGATGKTLPEFAGLWSALVAGTGSEPASAAGSTDSGSTDSGPSDGGPTRATGPDRP